MRRRDQPPAHVLPFFNLLQEGIIEIVQHGAESRTLRELDDEARAWASWWLDQPRDHAPPRRHWPPSGR